MLRPGGWQGRMASDWIAWLGQKRILIACFWAARREQLMMSVCDARLDSWRRPPSLMASTACAGWDGMSIQRTHEHHGSQAAPFAAFVCMFGFFCSLLPILENNSQFSYAIVFEQQVRRQDSLPFLHLRRVACSGKLALCLCFGWLMYLCLLRIVYFRIFCTRFG